MKYTIKTENTLGDTYLVDPALADYFILPLGQPGLNISIKPAPAGTQIVLSFKQTVGAGVINWPSNVNFAFNRTPKLAFDLGYSDEITLTTLDGTTWRGVFTGGWFNA